MNKFKLWIRALIAKHRIRKIWAGQLEEEYISLPLMFRGQKHIVLLGKYDNCAINRVAHELMLGMPVPCTCGFTSATGRLIVGYNHTFDAMMTKEEALATLYHELGHFINGDLRRGHYRGLEAELAADRVACEAGHSVALTSALIKFRDALVANGCGSNRVMRDMRTRILTARKWAFQEYNLEPKNGYTKLDPACHNLEEICG